MPEAKSSLSPLFPGDIGHAEHYTFSAPNCSAVSSCTVNQLPSFTNWRHQLFRVSFVLRPTNDCTCKKPDELIMQTRQQCTHDQLQDFKLYNNGCCTLNWTAWLSKGHMSASTEKNRNVLHWLVPALFKGSRSIVVHRRGLKEGLQNLS